METQAIGGAQLPAQVTTGSGDNEALIDIPVE